MGNRGQWYGDGWKLNFGGKQTAVYSEISRMYT